MLAGLMPELMGLEWRIETYQKKVCDCLTTQFPPLCYVQKNVLCQPRNICLLLLIAAVSYSRRVGSEQPPVKCAARASQRRSGHSDHSGEGKSASSGSRTSVWAGSQQSRWVARSQSGLGIVTLGPIRAGETVLPSSWLYSSSSSRLSFCHSQGY